MGRESYDREVTFANVITWVYDGESFTPVAKVTEQERYTIVHDYLGTPTQAYDSRGKLVWEMLLDVYGNAKEYTGEKCFIPFRYQGQYEDEKTELSYNRFRYYDPRQGNYISTDPIGLAGNNPTLYGYVKDTNSLFDVTGLSSIELDKLNKKLSALEKAQSTSVKERILPDGRIRYYGIERPAKTAGPTRGSSYVTEYNPRTGQVRSWQENYSQSGHVNRVHPKTNNGEVLDLPHYPPTQKDIDSGKVTSSGKSLKPCQ